MAKNNNKAYRIFGLHPNGKIFADSRVYKTYEGAYERFVDLQERNEYAVANKNGVWVDFIAVNVSDKEELARFFHDYR